MIVSWSASLFVLTLGRHFHRGPFTWMRGTHAALWAFHRNTLLVQRKTPHTPGRDRAVVPIPGPQENEIHAHRTNNRVALLHALSQDRQVFDVCQPRLLKFLHGLCHTSSECEPEGGKEAMII